MRELREIVSEENISDIEFDQYLLSFIWKCMKKEYKVVISTDKSDNTKLEITKGAFCSHIREIPAKFLAKRIN